MINIVRLVVWVERVFLSKLEKTFVLNLKGRISKVLGCSFKLKKEERDNLEGVYFAIDDLLLYRGTQIKNAHVMFQRALQGAIPVLGKTEKKYIREHILPLINKINTNKWEK